VLDIIVISAMGLFILFSGIYLVSMNQKIIDENRKDLDSVQRKKLLKILKLMGNIGIVVGVGALFFSGIFYLYKIVS